MLLTNLEELYCGIGSFILLLPIVVNIIRDMTYDCKFFSGSLRRSRALSDLQEDSIASTECNSLLSASKDDLTIPTIITSEGSFESVSNRTSKAIDNNSNMIQFNPFELLMFNTFIVFYYLIIRLCANTINLRRDYKFYASEMQDIYELTVRSTVVFVLGGVCNRKPLLSFLLSCAWYTCLYTLVFEVFPDTFQISQKMAMDGLLLLIVIAIFIVSLYVIGDNICFAWSVGKWRTYTFSLFIAIILFHIGVAMSADENVEIHLHHHHWAFILSLFVQSPKSSSYAMQALLIGIFVHGITVFGDEALFRWSATSPLNFGDANCEKWRCEQYKCELPKY